MYVPMVIVLRKLFLKVLFSNINLSTDKMFWTFHKIPRKMPLLVLRPATETNLELSPTYKMGIFVKTVNGFYLLFAKKPS